MNRDRTKNLTSMLLSVLQDLRCRGELPCIVTGLAETNKI